MIITVRNSREKKRLLELPWKLYKDDPNWIPPLRLDQKENLGYAKNPFYDRNEIQTFLAVKNNEPLGRLAAIVNHGHVERYKEKLGFLGFFECVDDIEVAAELFDAAREWLKEKGMTAVRGPINPSLNNTLGVLVEGFDTPPTFMMTYNPPYYEKLFEEYGFRKSQDLYAYTGHVSMLPGVREKLFPICEMIMERTGVKVRTLDKRHFARDVEEFLRIYNLALTNTWGFVPMTPAEVKHMAAGLKYLIVPELVIGVEIENKLVGAAFCLPDYNPRIKAIDGKLFPFGFIKLLRRKDLIKTVRMISTNVLPEYQMLGLGLVLMNGLVPKVLEWGIEYGEFSWILESNRFSRGSLEKAGVPRTKTYRVYDYGEAETVTE